MADISKITTPDDTSYNIKDSACRLMVAPEWNSTSIYGKNSIVTYQGKLYFSNSGGSGGNPPPEDNVSWTESTTGFAITRTSALRDVIAPMYAKSSSISYAVGAYCIKDTNYDIRLYRCIEATTGGNWDSSKWEHVFYLTDDLKLKANTSDLATVATSGSYADLSNKPTIPAAQVNADWNASSGVAQILNKPTIPDISTKVSKSGDTMTGDLLLNNKNSVARDTDINPSSNPSSTIYGNGHYLQRSDGSNLGYVRACKSNAGTDFMQIEAQRTISGTNYYNTINLNIASNGTKTVGVSDPSAWRSAIGINNNLATYISADGTNCISANNCNIQFIKCVRIGQMVTCTFHLAHSSAQTGGVAYVALKSDFRPSRQIFFPVSIVGNANAYANESAHRMYLYTDGTLKLNIDDTRATVTQVMGSVSYCIN